MNVTGASPVEMKFRRNYFGALVAAGLMLLGSTALAFETSYWVWQRNEPLSEAERSELSRQNVRTIYWQIGELENIGEAWQWKARFTRPPSEPDKLRFVQVVGMESRERSPFSRAWIDSLVRALSPLAKEADELQLDYDAPDRLLADYAAALRKIH